MIPVKCHTTLLENVKLIQTVECSGQATKTNMCLFYNKKKQFYEIQVKCPTNIE